MENFACRHSRQQVKLQQEPREGARRMTVGYTYCVIDTRGFEKPPQQPDVTVSSRSCFPDAQPGFSRGFCKVQQTSKFPASRATRGGGSYDVLSKVRSRSKEDQKSCTYSTTEFSKRQRPSPLPAAQRTIEKKRDTSSMQNGLIMSPWCIQLAWTR